MLTSLEIENFKCFRQLKIEPLAKVNLFVGTSNSGKTSILEALAIIPGKSSQQPNNVDWMLFRNGANDGPVNEEYAKWQFNEFANSKKIVINFECDTEPRFGKVFLSTSPPDAPGVYRPINSTPPPVFRWSLPKDLSLNTSVVTTSKLSAFELARSYDRWTLRAENDDRFVHFLQAVDPRLKSLRPMEHTGQRMLYADLRLPERIALPLLGEGFNRLVQVFGAIIGEGANIVLIDEIENGLHWSALPQIWTGIREAVNKEEVQIFATTHSLECISAAADAFKGEPKNDLAVHRLERLENGDIRCVTMNEDELQRMLDRDWEVR